MATRTIDELIIKANQQAVTINQMGTVLANIAADIAALKAAVDEAGIVNAKIDEAFTALEGNQNLLTAQLASMTAVDQSVPPATP